ncbi:Transcription factor [Rhizina undulata]
MTDSQPTASNGNGAALIALHPHSRNNSLIGGSGTASAAAPPATSPTTIETLGATGAGDGDGNSAGNGTGNGAGNNAGNGAGNGAGGGGAAGGGAAATTGASAGSQSPPTSSMAQSSTGRSPKKRRKVNHGKSLFQSSLWHFACVYCRRSHMTCDDDRPCTRCVKRNIGHLCHDEPREPKKYKTETPAAEENGQEDSNRSPPKAPLTPPVNGMSNSHEQQETRQSVTNTSSNLTLAPPPIPPPRSTAGPSVVAPSPVSAAPRSNLNANSQAFLGFTDWDIQPPQQQSNYTNPYHQQWMFSAPEVSSEFNLLSDFLGNLYPDDLFTGDQNLFSDTNALAPADLANGNNNNNNNNSSSFQQHRLLPPSNPNNVPSIMRPGSVKPSTERARENYYLTAADPSKDAPAEERMKQVLKAKLEAGLLRPFNYVKGYARLSQYMEKNMAQNSRRRILAQLDKFRPKFRERTHALTDLDLVHVEEWFERSLLEYDRVFASMAVPACLWRRTGEIFRGNKEFAELINVPIEQMRDGKLAIYELVVEDSAVSYWEKFGTIAFDTTQKAMLTSCHLKNPDPNAKEKLIHCCFSFTIRRDSYDIPALIIGNFLPIHPKKHITNS